MNEFMKNFSLEGKIAFVTGASYGIGFAIANALSAAGATIVFNDINQDLVNKGLAAYEEKGIKAHGYVCDVTDEEAVQKTVAQIREEVGVIDILVNNAGITGAKPIFDMTDEDFESMIDINLTGPFKCTREVAKVMKQTGGCIINTSSLVGTYASRMQTAYAASKFGINGLTKACARELGPYGIRVNAVAPGVVQTDMVAQSVDGQMLAALKGMTPLGRVAQPDELAGAYVYLASDAASFTTGAILAVDGGIVM